MGLIEFLFRKKEDVRHVSETSEIMKRIEMENRIRESIPSHDHRALVERLMLKNDDEFPIYPCSKSTYEVIKGVGLGNCLGVIETDNRKNVDSHNMMNSPSLAVFILEKAIEQFGEDILILDYTTLSRIGPERVSAEVYSSKKLPFDDNIYPPKILTLEELSTGGGIRKGVFGFGIGQLQQITGRRFVSPTDGIEVVKTLCSYSESKEVAAEKLMGKALHNFPEEKNLIIVDFKSYLVQQMDLAPYSWEASGIVAKIVY